MANQILLTRIKAIQQQLLGAHAGSSAMSTASRGSEREQFISLFLSQVLPPLYRFGTGDATDEGNRRSGQLDVVIEHPLFPSLPLVGSADQRLYIAESIAAVVEVKSDIAAQWKEFRSTADQLHALQRNIQNYATKFAGGEMIRQGRTTHIVGATFDGSRPQPMRMPMDLGHIPLFAVGYKGWRTPDTFIGKIDEGGCDGILVLDEPGFFVSSSRYGGVVATGGAALWAFICALHSAASLMVKTDYDPLNYVLP